MSEESKVKAFGELGLTGELRHVGHPERRLAEAAKFGLTDVARPGAGGAQTVRQALTGALGGARRREAA